MDKLECMLAGCKALGGKCDAPEECWHCGHERREAERRKLRIVFYGLTWRKDGLRGLAIQR